MDPVMERFCFGSTQGSLPMLSAEEILDPKREITSTEQMQRFGSAAYALYWQAERTRQLGISWRNFCVGCAMWAFREDASIIEHKWRCFTGMNTKVEQSSRNICAEPVPLNAAYAACCTKIVGMVVVGNPREEDTDPVLWPCEHCRLLMKKHPLIGGDTIVISALPPEGEPENWSQIRHEILSFADLLKKFGE